MKKHFLFFSFFLLLTSLFCEPKIEFYFVKNTETEALASIKASSDLPIEALLEMAENNFPGKAVGLYDYSLEDFPLYDVIILENQPILDNDSIKEISANKELNEYSIQIELTSNSSEYFGEITKENIGKKIAIVINNEAIFCAKLREPITGGKNINFTF